jgi:Flp pilus assembly pilin Flp
MNPGSKTAAESASRLTTDESGAVMIEFAIVFPIIVAGLLAASSLVSTIDLAQKVAIHGGSASRYLASAATDDGVSDAALRVARCLVVTGRPGTATVDCDPGLGCAIAPWCGEPAALSVTAGLPRDAAPGLISLHVEARLSGGAGAALPSSWGSVAMRLDRFRAGN